MTTPPVVTPEHVAWARDQRRQTAAVLIPFINERMEPEDAVEYAAKLEAKHPYPKLPEDE